MLKSIAVIINEMVVKTNKIIIEMIVVMMAMFIFCNKYEVRSINKQGF
jgi:hypothetical protein